MNSNYKLHLNVLVVGLVYVQQVQLQHLVAPRSPWDSADNRDSRTLPLVSRSAIHMFVSSCSVCDTFQSGEKSGKHFESEKVTWSGHVIFDPTSLEHDVVEGSLGWNRRDRWVLPSRTIGICSKSWAGFTHSFQRAWGKLWVIQYVQKTVRSQTTRYVINLSYWQYHATTTVVI